MHGVHPPVFIENATELDGKSPLVAVKSLLKVELPPCHTTLKTRTVIPAAAIESAYTHRFAAIV